MLGPDPEMPVPALMSSLSEQARCTQGGRGSELPEASSRAGIRIQKSRIPRLAPYPLDGTTSTSLRWLNYLASLRLKFLANAEERRRSTRCLSARWVTRLAPFRSTEAETAAVEKSPRVILRSMWFSTEVSAWHGGTSSEMLPPGEIT